MMCAVGMNDERGDASIHRERECCLFAPSARLMYRIIYLWLVYIFTKHDNHQPLCAQTSACSRHARLIVRRTFFYPFNPFLIVRSREKPHRVVSFLRLRLCRVQSADGLNRFDEPCRTAYTPGRAPSLADANALRIWLAKKKKKRRL